MVCLGPTVELPVPTSGTCIRTTHMCDVGHGSMVTIQLERQLNFLCVRADWKRRSSALIHKAEGLRDFPPSSAACGWVVLAMVSHCLGSLLPCLCLLNRLRPCLSTLILRLPLLPLLSSSSVFEALRGTLTSTSTSLFSPSGDVGARRVKLLRASGLRPFRTAEEPGWYVGTGNASEDIVVASS